MKFGFFHLMQAIDGEDEREVIRRDLELARMAEDLGFHSVFLAEHHFSPYCVDSSIATQAAYLAGRTERLRIGTAVAVLPYHHPLKAAEDWAMVDVMSGGRLELGVGRGYNPFEFAGFGLDPDERGGRFQEALEILELAWRGDRFSYHGRFYQVDQVQVVPRPIQQPHPRMYYAAMSEDSVRMAASRRMGVLTSSWTRLDDLHKRRFLFVQVARHAGHDDTWILDALNHMPIERTVWIANSQAEAEREARELYRRYDQSYADWCVPGHKQPHGPLPGPGSNGNGTNPGQDPLELVRDGRSGFVGDPVRVRDDLEAFLAEHPTPYLLLQPSRGGGSRDAIERTIRLFGEKVLPHFVGRAEFGSVEEALLRTEELQAWYARVRTASDEAASVIPSEDRFILVDDGEWGNRWRGIAGPISHRFFPFVEREGQYWGPPADDQTAIEELERLRNAGAKFMVFAWPAFWYLDYYQGLDRHLRSNFRQVLRTDHIVAFDLRKTAGA